MTWAWLDDHSQTGRPVLVAIAGSNGAGKTTFYHAHIKPAGFPLVNADQLASELAIDPYQAAQVATNLRQTLVRQRENFAFETVFSDPVGDKLRFLQETAQSGYTVALCFIGLSSAKLSIERVAMRVSQSGHDVPTNKLKSRYPRTLANLKAAVTTLPHVLVFDNSNLAKSYQLLAVYEDGKATQQTKSLPRWFHKVLA
ncbi:MAG: AAA family ATPase [Planctomycetes bacterium]|nr:AAA family ATPase [Planctomycetota bacterium]